MYQESEPGDILATFEASAYRCFLFRFPFCPIASFVCRKAKAAAYARFQRKVMAVFSRRLVSALFSCQGTWKGACNPLTCFHWERANAHPNREKFSPSLVPTGRAPKLSSLEKYSIFVWGWMNKSPHLFPQGKVHKNKRPIPGQVGNRPNTVRSHSSK